MLQLIGWLGCVYLVVKALEFGCSAAFRDAEGKHHQSAVTAIWICLIAAFVFAILFYVQGQAVGEAAAFGSDGPTTPADAYSQCLDDATTMEEISACRP